MRPEERIQERLEALRARGLWRDPGAGVRETGGAASNDRLRVDARSNDYLGLARAPVSRETVEGWGYAGAGASRLISGTMREHEELESAIAAWLGVQSCLLFSSAYAANTGVLGAVAVAGDAVFSDALNHASIIDGCRLGRAEVVVVPHLDVEAMERALSTSRVVGARWVVTESYFGMDADVPDLRGLRRLCELYGAGLIVDEAHAIGVFGPEGRGLCAEVGVSADVLIGGMGKAMGIQGGFAACSNLFREWLWNRARSFVFSTAPSPLLCRIGLERLAQLRGADRERRRLAELEARLEQLLRSQGVPLAGRRRGPIFPIVFGDERRVMAAARGLEVLGVACQPIRPPTVPAGGSRLRVSLRADMSELDVDTLGGALSSVWRSAQPAGGATAATIVASGALSPIWPRIGDGVSPARAPSAGANRTWIVLGTGTGVGKTFVAEHLVRRIARRGYAVAGLKPIETGLVPASNGPQAQGDATRLEAASFHVKHPRPHPLFAFEDAVAPALASRRANAPIDFKRLGPWLSQLEGEPHEPRLSPIVVFETAGGVFSPVTDTANNLDLSGALGAAEWILVAPDRLGALHDVLSTLRAMESCQRAPEWLVLSAPSQPDSATGTNASELLRLGIKPGIITLGRDETAPLETILDDALPDLATPSTGSAAFQKSTPSAASKPGIR